MHKQPILPKRMKFTLVMDRPAIPEHYYISPGGYAIRIGDRTIAFDFEENYGYINNENHEKVEFITQNLDTDVYPEAKQLTLDLFKDNNDISFEEFTVHTGEYDDPEIIPLKAEDIIIIFDDNTKIHIKDVEIENNI